MAAAMDGTANRPGLTQAPADTTGLLALLARLDALIAYVLSAEQSQAPPADVEDAFRGLHIGPDEVARLLAAEPGQPLLPPTAPRPQLLPSAGARPLRLAALAAQYDLAAFDIDVLLIALAPEFDLRYERLYAYL